MAHDYCGSIVVCSLLTSLSSCVELRGVEPIPREKQAFVGRWNSEVGIALEISPDGTANLLRRGKTSGSEKLDIGASNLNGFRVYFPRDSTLLLIQPFNIAREYTITEYPSKRGVKITMSLNGVTLVKE